MGFLRTIPVAQLRDVKARRICIIKPSALGDIVQALPVLSALRARFPQARLSWVVKREWASLLACQPELDEVIEFGARSGARGWWRLGTELRSRRFDLVFDLQGLMRTGFMTVATGAPLRVGLQTAREGAQWACNCVLPGTDRSVPAHARYARVADVLGCEPSLRRATITLPSQDQQWAQRQLACSRGDLWLALHVGAAWPTKRWPVAKFAEVAARAVDRLGAAILIVGGPADQQAGTELELALARANPSAAVLNLVGRTRLTESAALLAQASVLISNDSGPMHLAAALGTPVVGIFTCTSPYRSGPPGDEHELVSTRVGCAGSYRKRCPLRGVQFQHCLAELPVDRVWNALVRLVQKHEISRFAA